MEVCPYYTSTMYVTYTSMSSNKFCDFNLCKYYILQVLQLCDYYYPGQPDKVDQ